MEVTQNKNLIHPFKNVIVGRSESGKSTLIRKLIEHDLKGDFDVIYILSPTVKADPVWEDLDAGENTEVKIYDRINKATMKKVIERSKRLKEKKQWIIIDDSVGRGIRSKSASGMSIVDQAFTGVLRHYNGSITISIQQLTAVSPIVRSNATSYIIFELGSKSHFKHLLQDIGFTNFQVSWENMKKILQEKPFNFIFIDRQQSRRIVKSGLDRIVTDDFLKWDSNIGLKRQQEKSNQQLRRMLSLLPEQSKRSKRKWKKQPNQSSKKARKW